MDGRKKRTATSRSRYSTRRFRDCKPTLFARCPITSTSGWQPTATARRPACCIARPPACSARPPTSVSGPKPSSRLARALASKEDIIAPTTLTGSGCGSVLSLFFLFDCNLIQPHITRMSLNNRGIIT